MKISFCSCKVVGVRHTERGIRWKDKMRLSSKRRIRDDQSRKERTGTAGTRPTINSTSQWCHGGHIIIRSLSRLSGWPSWTTWLRLIVSKCFFVSTNWQNCQPSGSESGFGLNFGPYYAGAATGRYWDIHLWHHQHIHYYTGWDIHLPSRLLRRIVYEMVHTGWIMRSTYFLN